MSKVDDEQALFDTLECPVLRVDATMVLMFANRFARRWMANGDDPVGQSLAALVPPDAGDNNFVESIRERLVARDSRPIRGTWRGTDGNPRCAVWSLGFAAATESQTEVVLIGAVCDKDSDKPEDSANPSGDKTGQAFADLMLRTVADGFAAPILVTAADQTILYANAAVLNETGYSAAEVLGRTPALFKSGQTGEETYHSLCTALESGYTWKGDFINQRKDGSQFVQRMTIAAVRGDDGAIRYYFAVGDTAATPQGGSPRVENLLAYDPLTGLPNRGAFLRTLVDALDDAPLTGGNITVLHIDIDDFFVVSDALGTAEADNVIAAIGERIAGVLRQADILAHLGDDKFSILLDPRTPGAENDAREVAARILEAVREPLVCAGRTNTMTASVGIAAYPADGEDASTLLSHAMNATERAKTAGGNEVRRFDAVAASSVSGQRELLHDLARAIEHGELVLHYQPQVSLFSGSVIGLEALVRWQHPDRGMVPPGQFIPLAEHSYHIIHIGEWVLHEACRQMRVWMDSGLPPLKVAVNLGARHFRIPDLHSRVAGTLAKHDIEPGFLEIEITEGVMMHEVQATVRSTAQLKQLGVRISLDDFGTGYSSLAYLSRYPIDVVKIDQSFVRDVTTNPVNAAITQAIIAMSHKLGKVVLAEGVETEEQMHYLRRNECDEMQGYLFSRPVPAEDVGRLLRDGAAMRLSGQQDAEKRSTVLFLDDEPNILTSLKRTLRREGYDILTAETATDAFSLLACNEVQVIISDQRMPEMNGTEFLARVKNLYPQTVRMVLSGYSEISTVTDSINKGAVYRFMLKPWDDEKLKAEIAGALRHWRELYGERN